MREAQKFTIPNRLASYGELMATCANNSEALRAREDHNIRLVRWAIREAGIEEVRGRVAVHVHWVEPSSSRKFSHVAAAAVFVEDALIVAGIIKNPISQIECIYSTFAVNAGDPRVEVTIEPR